jgi:hypothetical protein
MMMMDMDDRSWKTSVDHSTVWQALCKTQSWPWLGKEQVRIFVQW